MRYVLTDEGEPWPVKDGENWGRWMGENRDLCRVALSEGPMGRISTVFLGIDSLYYNTEPPMLFESLVEICGNEEVYRHETLEKAVQTHLTLLENKLIIVTSYTEGPWTEPVRKRIRDEEWHELYAFEPYVQKAKRREEK